MRAVLGCTLPLHLQNKSECVQLNANVSAFQRHFVKEIRRADEMERRLRKCPLNLNSLMSGFLESHVDTAKIRIRQLTEPEFMTAPSAHELDIVDEATARHEERVTHLLESKASLEKTQADLIEFRHVLRETAAFFHVCAERGCILISGWWYCRQCANEFGNCTR